VATTRTYGGNGTPVDDQSLGELVATATRDLSELIHKEIELGKTEIAAEAKRAGIGAGFLSGAGLFGVFALVFFNFAAAYGLAAGADIPVWAGFLCVGGLYAIIGGALVALGMGKLVKVGPPARTIRTVKDDVAWAKHPTKAPPSAELEELRASHT
jgi:putative superfamily III holin-X